MKLKKYSSSGGLQGRRVRALERLTEQEMFLTINKHASTLGQIEYAKKSKRIENEIKILTKRVTREDWNNYAT